MWLLVLCKNSEAERPKRARFGGGIARADCATYKECKNAGQGRPEQSLSSPFPSATLSFSPLALLSSDDHRHGPDPTSMLSSHPRIQSCALLKNNPRGQPRLEKVEGKIREREYETYEGYRERRNRQTYGSTEGSMMSYTVGTKTIS